MNKLTLLSVSLAFIAVSSVASVQQADAQGWGVNGRQARQERRINQGIQNGSLNGREASRLNRAENKLDRQEARMRASGNGLSYGERQRLEREQNQISHNIYGQKHDAQGWNNGHGGGWNGQGNGGWKNGNHPNYNQGVNARQANQQNRLSQGVQSGQLTASEYSRLQNRETQLANQEARMRASGNGLNPQERARLEAEQASLSRSIYKQTHDGQTR